MTAMRGNPAWGEIRRAEDVESGKWEPKIGISFLFVNPE
jgi:hypothetical protein